ncbi:MAG: LPS-assembly protein LptD [Rhodoferax sp.]|nr:LPS-assembly protein LptD [Pseudorhodobacter sp.]
MLDFIRRAGLVLLICSGVMLARLPDAKAQDLASLVAERVEITGTSQLIAEGDVEIFFKGRRLKAQRIVYDSATDRLQITGPIVLVDDSGTFILASQADLSADLADGVLKSARLVLNQQLQLASTEVQRVGGRYTRLGRTVASSCQVCAANPRPLWEIRASQVVHDQQTRQLYFDDAQFRIAGIPVFYLPRLRIPDPTLKRANGFLRPKLRTTSGLGTGIKLPYFLAIGDSADLTITPYATLNKGRAVELRYRQAFRTGTIEVNGAFARDALLPGENRGYFLATGGFVLPRDFQLSFRLEAVTDPAYLLDYGVSEKDRLDSRLAITRTRRNEYMAAQFTYFNSIRDAEVNATLPSVIGDLTFHRRFSGGPLGGEAGLQFQTHSHRRASASTLDADGNGISDGRDLSRASLRLDWRRGFILSNGIEVTGLGEMTADFYSISQDAIYGGNTARVHGAAAVELRWPWLRATAGASHVIEPIAQLIWSPSTAETLPNEDSALVEFDEGNLFSLNRFPGSDATERGVRANLGVSWTRYDPEGWSVGATLGRVVRARDLNQFGVASGLDGPSSDWLAAVQLTMASGLQVTNRLVFDDGFDMTKGEVRLDLAKDRYGISSGYIWNIADLSENRPDPTSELAFDGYYKLSEGWTGKASGRYDFEASRATKAGLGLEFKNECVVVDLSLSRRFTSSTSVQPTTDFGLSVELAGIGGGTKAGPARRCSR